MSPQLLVLIENLYKLHSSLYTIAMKKTEVIKQGDIESLNGIMNEEHKHIHAIKQLEEARLKAAKEICPEKESPTVTDCLERMKGSEQEQLLAAANKLAELLANIKEQNQLNQQLLHNSLKFVQFSLQLLRPEHESYNYVPPTKKQPNVMTSGMFNSKV